ncbi:MAG: KH domain-containing protein, partial [Clostridia bacterium]|nr:KH domain-containing protein [Clostridia bacterium]
GDALGVLIGRRGETLDALQYLTSLYVNKDREGYLRVSLDSESYRAKREESLRRLAVRMAQRARKNGRRVVLEPMNPYERRILHSALQNNPYVETHSEGEDPYRRVIITLK